MTKKFALPSIVFELTEQCNLACRYCYNHRHAPGFSQSYEKQDYYSKIKTLKKLFSQADVHHVSFSGGEPFLSERLVEIALFARLKAKSVSIITNGTLINRNYVRQLVSLSVRLFEIPVLSHKASVHDDLTQKQGSHSAVVASAEILKSEGAQPVAVVILTKTNSAEIVETLQFIKSLGIRRIMVNRFNIGGRGVREADYLQLSRSELQKTFEMISKTASKEKLNISSNVSTPMCILNPAHYQGIRFGFCTTDVSRRPLTVESNGNIRFCNHSPLVLGNIFTQNIKEILKNKNVEVWETRPKECIDCTDFELCKGGCRAASEQLHKTAASVDPIFYLHD